MLGDEHGAAMSQPARGLALTLLEQRDIEARIVGPLVRGFIARFGREEALQVVREVISELARASGREAAGCLASATLGNFAGCVERWSEGGALELEWIDRSETAVDFNVTRCRFAEMYRALGLADLGGALSCQRDFALVEGFNPEIELQRTQTMMEGAAFCDFRFRMRDGRTQSG